MHMDEARPHLRDRLGNSLDRAAPYASLRLIKGLGAKSSCKIRNMQRRCAPCTIVIKPIGWKANSGTQPDTISCAWVSLVANRTRFRASKMAGPAHGDDRAFRTSVSFGEPIGSLTVKSIVCLPMSGWSLSRARTSTRKSAGLSVLCGTSARVS
jgi:hypothetical protein